MILIMGISMVVKAFHSHDKTVILEKCRTVVFMDFLMVFF